MKQPTEASTISGKKYNHQHLLQMRPSDLIKTALNKNHSAKLKRTMHDKIGLRQFYWDHIKNYSQEMKYQEDKFIADRVKQHSLKSFLAHYIKKPSGYTFLTKIVKKLLKQSNFQIPEDDTRKQLWLLFSGASSSILKNMNYYEKLDKQFNDSVKPAIIQIEMDIRRTVDNKPEIIWRDKMLRVLLNYCKRNTIIGYVQGMHHIVLYLLKSNFTEEETFWTLTSIIENYLSNEWYGDFRLMWAELEILDLIMYYQLPALFNHFKQQQFDIMPFMSSTWIQLFMHCNSKIREIILDNFFVNGPIVF